MTSIEIFGEIRKRQTELKVTDKELRRIANLSPKQWRSRSADPNSFKLGEVVAICNYLGIK